MVNADPDFKPLIYQFHSKWLKESNDLRVERVFKVKVNNAFNSTQSHALRVQIRGFWPRLFWAFSNCCACCWRRFYV